MKKKLMKQVVSNVLAIAMVASNITINTSVVEAATTFTVDNLNYQVVDETKLLVAVTGMVDTTASVLEIPESVSYGETEYKVNQINRGSFSGNENLTEVYFPESLQKIYPSAFSNCTNLSVMTLPSGLTSLGGGAFKDCDKITSVTIPKNLESGGEDAYAVLSNHGAFDECDGLKTIIIANGSQVIADYLFANCPSIDSLDDIVIPTSVKVIEEGAFLNCKISGEVVIPDDVQTIGSSAFSGCSQITKVICGRDTGTIGNNAFKDCSSIEGIVFTDNITSIGSAAFSNCVELLNIDLPKNLENMGAGAFRNCDKITSVLIPKNVSNGGFGSTTLANDLGAFDECDGLQVIEIEDGATTIADGLFANCPVVTSLKDIIIPSSVTSIGQKAFASCETLISAEIPNHINVISTSAFTDCVNLVNVSIPDSVTTVNDYAFANITNLKEIYWGNAITYVDNNAFARTTNVISYVPMYSTTMKTFVESEIPARYTDFDNTDDTNFVIDLKKSNYTINSNRRLDNITLNTKYEIKQTEVHNISDMKLEYNVPAKSTINYVVLDGKVLSTDEYTITSKNNKLAKKTTNVVSIPVTEPSGECVLYVTPGASGNVNSYASMKYTKDETICEELIGAVSEKCMDVTLFMEDEVEYTEEGTSNLSIWGYGVPGNTVTISVNNVSKQKVTVNDFGIYSTTQELTDAEEGKVYSIKIVSKNYSGTNVTLIKDVVTVSDATNVEEAYLLTDVYQYYDGPEIYNLKKDESVIDIICHAGQEYKLTTKISNDDNVSDVYFVSNRGGVVNKFKTEKVDNIYQTNGTFSESELELLGSISIEYYKDGQLHVVDVSSGVRFIDDANGYVYEGVTTNIVEGCGLTLLYKETEDSEEQVVWTGIEFEGFMPNMSDIYGEFAWLINGEGYWQVRADKDGYVTGESTWLETIPAQTDFVIKMTKEAPAKVVDVVSYETYTTVEFDQYIDPETIDNLVIKDANGNVVETAEAECDLSETDHEGIPYAKKFTFRHNTVVEAGTTITLSTNENILNSSGRAVEVATTTEVVESHLALTTESALNVTVDETIKVGFTITNLDNAAVSVTVEDDSLIKVGKTYQSGNYYTAVLKATYDGNTKIVVSLDDYGITEEVVVTINKKPITISDDIEVNGFQISATKGGHRTVYSVEDTIDGKEVVSKGLVYSLGDFAPVEELHVGSRHPYVASWKATEEGKASINYSDSKTASSYVMTMLISAGNKTEFNTTFRVRAYAELSDGSYVYSEAEEYTVYKVADVLYQNRRMSNYGHHNYLYTDILTIVDPAYKKVDYDWNDALVKF